MNNYLILFSCFTSLHTYRWSKLPFQFLFLVVFLIGQNTVSFGLSNYTCISISDKNTQAGQLLLTNIQLKSEVETHYVAVLTATNLSGQAVQFGTSIAPDINIKFEESFSRHPLNPYKEEILDALLDTNLQILSRKTMRGIELMLEKTKPLAERYVGRSYDAQLFKVKRKKSSPKKQKIKKPTTETPTEAHSDSVIEIAKKENPAPPLKERKSLRFIRNKKESKKEDVVENTNPIDEKNVEVAVLSEDTVNEADVVQEEIVLTPNNDPLTENIISKPKRDKKPFIKLSKRKKVVQEEKESISFTSNIEEEEDEASFYYNESACADIVIDSIQVVKNQKDKWLTVQYTITNQGTKSADLYGKAGDDADNLAIKVFMASSENLTRGSIPIGGSFIKNGIDDGILLPNQSHTGTFKIDIRKKTSFTPFLIFSADHFNVMVECDKTNNKNHLFVE